MNTELGTTSLVGKEGWKFDLIADRAAQANQSTGEVVIGIRHGQINHSPTELPGYMRASIYTIEPTGDLTYVYINLGSHVLVSSAPSSYQGKADDPIWISFDQDHMHLFDANTDLALPGGFTRRLDPTGGTVSADKLTVDGAADLQTSSQLREPMEHR